MKPSFKLAVVLALCPAVALAGDFIDTRVTFALANSNVFTAKDGQVFTPMPNGTFLNGITRQRIVKLLRGAGITVTETVMKYRDLETADEIFATGNASKVLPVTRIGERALQPGPMFRKARELYWAFAHGG